MPSVEYGHISGIEVMHAIGKISVRCLKKNMEMRVHEYPRKDTPITTLGHVREEIRPFPSILIVTHNRLVIKGMAGNVVDAIGNIDPKRTSHSGYGRILQINGQPNRTFSRPDPWVFPDPQRSPGP